MTTLIAASIAARTTVFTLGKIDDFFLILKKYLLSSHHMAGKKIPKSLFSFLPYEAGCKTQTATSISN
jgi:hypothetical protein